MSEHGITEQELRAMSIGECRQLWPATDVNATPPWMIRLPGGWVYENDENRCCCFIPDFTPHFALLPHWLDQIDAKLEGIENRLSEIRDLIGRTNF